MRPIDLNGMKFGRLTVVKRHGSDYRGEARWYCECECGSSSVVVASRLREGNTKSCGCYKRECTAIRKTTHGHSGARRRSEYHIWSAMRQRCANPNSRAYPEYGGRGITVCPEWESYERFFADMGPKPKNGTIERLDNDKGYSPENCVWASRVVQNLNQRMRKTNKSGFVGVYWKDSHKKWAAVHRRKHLGYFTTREEAAVVYEVAKTITLKGALEAM